MFIEFLHELKRTRVPVSTREYLMLLEAVDQGLADYGVDDFYYLARALMARTSARSPATSLTMSAIIPVVVTTRIFFDDSSSRAPLSPQDGIRATATRVKPAARVRRIRPVSNMPIDFRLRVPGKPGRIPMSFD